MKIFIFIHGPNGVGKSTVCKAVHQQLAHSAWLDSEWCRMIHPFTWNNAVISLTTQNITHMLRGYLSCAWLEYVIFSYGFHGPRQQIWEAVLRNIQDIPYTFIPITLTCGEEELVFRMTRDGRDPGRIQRALAARHLYDGLPYPRIDTTYLTVQETASRVMEIIQKVA